MKINFKRIGAYIFDVILVSLVANLIASIDFINPNYKKYNEYYENYNNELSLYQDFLNDFKNSFDDEKVDNDEYEELVSNYPDFSNYLQEKYDDLEINSTEYKFIFDELSNLYEDNYISYGYELSRLNLFLSVTTIICIFIYFVVIQYFMNGQTLGKKIFNLKVVDLNKNRVCFLKLFVRTVIFSGVIISIIQIICLFSFSAVDYNKANYFLYLAGTSIEFLTILTIFMRVDHRGFHDLIAGTQVIENCVNTTDIIEADFVEKN